MFKKSVFVFLIVCLLFTPMAGCNDLLPEGSPSTSRHEEKMIRHNHGQEPETIDPSLCNTVDGGNIVLAVFEGLTKLDENDNPLPGVAAAWDISQAQTVYTFHLRNDAKWADGQPVTARDFVFSWKRALEPETAAEYSYMLYCIKNAELFNTGKEGVKFEDVGIKALDDYTLEVVLEAPTPYFLKLTAFPTYMPLREDIINEFGDDWALSPSSYLGNGPFKLAEWKSKDMMRFVKNEHYYGKDNIKIDGFIKTFIAEASTMLSAFEAGELDVIDEVPLDEIARLKNESPEFHIIPQVGTYYYSFNVKKAPFDNPKVRKAFALAIDREDIATKVWKSGLPATGFIPPGVPDATPGADFRTVGGAFFPEKADPLKARQLLSEAGYPDGRGFPRVTLLFNTGEAHQKIAEAVLEMWKRNLGIDNLAIQSMEGAVFQNARLKGDYQVARSGWIADYNDPSTFIELFTTGSGNNDAQWTNKTFDRLVQEARKAIDENTRMELLHQAEKLMLEEAIVMPIFYYTENTMIKSYVKGLHKSALGFTYFDRAEVLK